MRLLYIIFTITIHMNITHAITQDTAQEIFKSIRCMVCASQSIDESNAEFAQNLRTLILNKLNQGETREAIEEYLVSRYGESILFSTPFNKHTILLWVTPIIFLIIGLYIIFIRLKKC
ncbi:MAG: cytochrome c-type biogenesis protein CcmH [Rickettsiales endosymbiont of Dermacentor nuttalli]